MHLDALPGLENQRILTALVYLNDAYLGGETEFTRLGLKVKGRKGDVLVAVDGKALSVAATAASSGTKVLALSLTARAKPPTSKAPPIRTRQSAKSPKSA